MRDYLCSAKCGLSATAKIGGALDRAPRPYTAGELAEITQLPLGIIKAFLRRNTTCEKVNSHSIARIGGGRPMQEYWRGMSGIFDTFKVENMMDDKTEGKLREGIRPVAWRDANFTNWSIDETDQVATMRGGAVVRLGKVEGISYSKQGVTVTVKDGIRLTFRRA